MSKLKRYIAMLISAAMTMSLLSVTPVLAADGITGVDNDDVNTYTWTIGNAEEGKTEYTDTNAYADLTVSMASGDTMSETDGIVFMGTAVPDNGSVTNRYIIVEPKRSGTFTINVTGKGSSNNRVYYYDFGTGQVDLSQCTKKAKIAKQLSANTATDVTISMEKGSKYAVYPYTNKGGGVISAMSYEYLDKEFETISDGLDKKYMHISFDDVYACLKDITDKKDTYKSIFDNSFFADLKSLHDAYGAVFTLNCFVKTTKSSSYDISNLPKDYAEELKSNASWLKFAFHAEDDNATYGETTATSNGKLATVEEAKRSYKKFTDAIMNAADNNVSSIDTVTRLGFFSGNLENVRALSECDYGITGLLTADDTRISYYFDAALNNHIINKGYHFDSDTNLKLIKTQTRLENISNSVNGISALEGYGGNMVEIFTHESEYSKVKTILSDYIQWAFANGYGFDYAMYLIEPKTENPDLESTGKPSETVMSIVSDSTGDTTVIDTSNLYRDEHVTQFAVVTADMNGNKVLEYKTPAALKVSVNTKGADKVEIVPVFHYDITVDKTEVKIADVDDGLYNMSFKKSGSKRTDIYVNGAMVANNVDKDGYSRSAPSGTEIGVNDIAISDGSIRVKLEDTASSGYQLSSCEYYKASTIGNRKKKIFILGDSLVANYYGTPKKTYNYSAGWGQVIDSYFTDNVDVVNLANGGHYATILETTAFPGVMANAQSGDCLIIESGYNDTKYNTADEVRESVERMVNAAKQKGLTCVVSSPNASMNECDPEIQKYDCTSDYNPSVHYASVMRQAAENTGAVYVDLSGESYKFYSENFGTDAGAVEEIKRYFYFPDEPDYLHHNYLGAMNCARIVAQGMYNAGIRDFIDTDYSLSFTLGDRAFEYKINTISEPTIGPTFTPTIEPSDKIKASAKVSGSIYDVTADAGRENGTLIAAAYKDGILLTVKTENYKGAERNIELNTSETPTSIKVMLWDSLDNMKSIMDSAEITEFEKVPQQTASPEPPKELENEAQTLDLAGSWGLKLAAYSNGIATDDTVTLPGTLSENQKGSANTKTDKTKLSLKYTYTGKAVYQKNVMIPEDWKDKSVTLTMERTKLTRVWVNGEEQTNCNTNNSLSVPHEYYLNNLNAGKDNIITVEVENGTGNNEGKADNVYGLYRTKTHMLTAETQTDWNGIIGEIALKASDKVYIKDVKVYPDVDAGTATVNVTVQNDTASPLSGSIVLKATSYNHDGEAISVPSGTETITAASGENEYTFTYSMGDDVKLWSEFHPALYSMAVSLTAGDNKSDYRESFGMREWGTSEGQFTINGKKTFLRGEANSAVFPITGYPFMTKEEWTEFFKKAQSMGINFFRFHSWTPPMAAFEAADELGIYMQPEMYGFGGTPSDSDYNGLYGLDGEKILKYYASNPSFVMMTFGNEMTTNGAGDAKVEAYRARLKAIDPTRLYAEGTNNNLSNSALNINDDFWTTAKTTKDGSDNQVRLSFAWNNSADGGRLEGEQPNSCQNYNKAMENLNSDVPIMGHEVGQYQVYPNFAKEIPKYERGVFAPRNLEAFRSTMDSKGLLNMNAEFSKTTARTSAIAYRADMEAALKTNNFGGYQLLSIQDFPGQNTALMGILDCFMDDKEGGFTSEEYKSFNSPVTALAEIPKYIYKTTDDFTADIVLTNYSEDNITGTVGSWSIKRADGSVLKQGTLAAKDAQQGAVTTLGAVNETGLFAAIASAEKMTFTVSANGSENSYSIWIYPDASVSKPDNLLIADAYTNEVREALAAGGRVLMIPTPTKSNLPRSVSVRWTNDYWSSMFHGRVDDAATTMGLYINEDHPAFADFPTEFFGDYQWYNLMKNSRAVILDNVNEGLMPIAQNIDHMAYSRKLGSIFEAKVGDGSLLVCTMDILGQMENYPEVKQMYNSLVKYASSEEFAPSAVLTTDELRTIFKQVGNSKGELDPYTEIFASTYSWSKTSSTLKSQTGTDENGNKVTDALGGISAGDMIRFDNVNFGGNGSVKVKITAANGGSSGEDAVIDIYLGSESGDKAGTLNFKNTGSWDKFTTQEFEISHLWGVKNILLKFINANICIESIEFIQDENTYCNPYIRIDPSNTSEALVRFDSKGGEAKTEQLSVTIKGAVDAVIKNSDFGFDGSKQILLGGSMTGSGTTLDLNIKYTENGIEKVIPITFTMGSGEKYTLESGTTGGITFWRNTIDITDIIKGVTDITLEFPAETDFIFSDIAFVDSAKAEKVWDLTKLYKEQTTFDTIEDKTVVTDDLVIVGGGASDFIDPNAGLHYNGKAAISGGTSNRYFMYMPKTDGTIKLTVLYRNSNSKLYVTESLGNSAGEEVPGISVDTKGNYSEVEISVFAYTPYYFYPKDGGVTRIKKIEFIPD